VILLGFLEFKANGRKNQGRFEAVLDNRPLPGTLELAWNLKKPFEGKWLFQCTGKRLLCRSGIRPR
jgi:hypothetical protein